MKAHLKYLKYLLRHKWYVFLECRKLGIAWLGIIHDWSKFRPSEWFPYTRHFYGPQSKQWRDKTGYYKPTDTGDPDFDLAWFWHQKRNKHHWQYWTLPGNGGFVARPMPDKYCQEMLADWRGAGRAQNKPDTRAWYLAHRDKMQLHPTTRVYIDWYFSIEKMGFLVSEENWSTD